MLGTYDAPPPSRARLEDDAHEGIGALTDRLLLPLGGKLADVAGEVGGAGLRAVVAVAALLVRPTVEADRVLAVGFHATVGPRTKLFTALPRVSFVVTFLYSISIPIFRRSLGKRTGIIAA